MIKPQLGDIVFMAFAVVAMVGMLLLGQGRRDVGDTEAEQRTLETYLRQLGASPSPILVLAMIVGLGALAYVLIALYSKAT